MSETAHGIVAHAIAQEEALERVQQVVARRRRSEEDHKRRRVEIDTKLAKAIRTCFDLGLTATRLAKLTGLSEPRIYQLKLYKFDPDEEMD